MNPAEIKRLRVACGALALLLLALAVFYVRPAVTQYKQTQVNLGKMQAELQLVGPVFSQRQKSQVELKAKQKEVARVEAQLPVGADAETLLKRFDSLARSCGATLVGIKSGDPKQTTMAVYQVLPLHLTLSGGGLGPLQAFLQKLEDAQQFPGLTAESLQLRSVETNGQPGGYSLELELSQLIRAQ